MDPSNDEELLLCGGDTRARAPTIALILIG